MIVFATRYASANVPSTLVVAKSPIVTPICSAPGLARSFATIASDRSIPCTRTPRRAQRERDPAGPDAEFERVPAACEIGQERDDGIDDVGIRLGTRTARRSAPPRRGPKWSSGNGAALTASRRARRSPCTRAFR